MLMVNVDFDNLQDCITDKASWRAKMKKKIVYLSKKPLNN